MLSKVLCNARTVYCMEETLLCMSLHEINKHVLTVSYFSDNRVQEQDSFSALCHCLSNDTLSIFTAPWMTHPDFRVQSAVTKIRKRKILL